MFRSDLKQKSILQDDPMYLCLSKLLPDSVKRPMPSVNRCIFPFDVRIGGSLYSARGSGEKEKRSLAWSLMQASDSITPSERISLVPLDGMCILRIVGCLEENGAATAPPGQ